MNYNLEALSPTLVRIAGIRKTPLSAGQEVDIKESLFTAGRNRT